MINILPVSQKEKLKTDRSFAVVNLLGMVVVFILVSFVLALLAAGAYLDGKLGSRAIEAEGLDKQLAMMNAAQIEKTISGYATQCKDLNNFYSKLVSPATEASQLANALPRGIELFQMSVIGPAVSIDGMSADRENLVKMQESLNKTAYFKNVNIPPSAWVRQENISFSAAITYDPGK